MVENKSLAGFYIAEPFSSASTNDRDQARCKASPAPAGWPLLYNSSPGNGFRFGTRSSTFLKAPLRAFFARAAMYSSVVRADIFSATAEVIKIPLFNPLSTSSNPSEVLLQ